MTSKWMSKMGPCCSLLQKGNRTAKSDACLSALVPNRWCVRLGSALAIFSILSLVSAASRVSLPATEQHAPEPMTAPAFYSGSGEELNVKKVGRAPFFWLALCMLARAIVRRVCACVARVGFVRRFPWMVRVLSISWRSVGGSQLGVGDTMEGRRGCVDNG